MCYYFEQGDSKCGYLKLKSNYGTLLGYKFYQKLDDFYSSLCRKKLYIVLTSKVG